MLYILRLLFNSIFPYTTLFRSHPAYRQSFRGQVAADTVALMFRRNEQIRQVPEFLDQDHSGNLFADTIFEVQGIDRKSTRLNSSHVKISYAVFCLKKKK